MERVLSISTLLWIWKRIEKIKKSNEDILSLAGEERCMLCTLKVIATRKRAWIGHVVRGDGLD